MYKPYFAKWLPVEGDIKKGDRYVVTGGIGSLPGHYISDGNTAKNDWNKKVKLFLCSRDIQVGDKITGHHVEYDTFFIADNLHIESNKVNFPEGRYIKIIGEISPEAIWVKEGDEFKLTDFNPLSAAAIEHNKPITEPIRIKGPCGHFH